MFAMVSSSVHGAPDHVCYLGVSGAPDHVCDLGGVRGLSRVWCKGQGKQSGFRIQGFNFYLKSMLV